MDKIYRLVLIVFLIVWMQKENNRQKRISEIFNTHGCVGFDLVGKKGS